MITLFKKKFIRIANLLNLLQDLVWNDAMFKEYAACHPGK